MIRPDWHQHAACRGGEMIHIFFPQLTSRKHVDRVSTEICSTCPVRRQCADAGRNEPYGIWAGGYDYERAARRG